MWKMSTHELGTSWLPLLPLSLPATTIIGPVCWVQEFTVHAFEEQGRVYGVIRLARSGSVQLPGFMGMV